ncbi:MoaD/ThiS family protein [Sphingobacterium cellulitidis]|uniref:Molybdopterin synthase sulfur carrier subunit n=1 Tax=Sphingobacterium cellulitidis TaxID=1768011 RepID=A0A8H9FZL5_9SPHI|nr:MoaD/ThiS family protein [Sphingobacterium soli]MBA8986983.1 molybdopterin synthase sulfur carrier subunit [Sphingobacterium soli]GGE15418.1 molybdopterin converting factor small subunit [Sphingobacterium soli]
MKIKLLGFGIVREIFGNQSIEIDVDEGLTVSGLRGVLETKYPKMMSLKSYMIALDEEYADENQEISNLHEIAVIPPVSGG